MSTHNLRHLNESVRQAVPNALNSVGMPDLADKIRRAGPVEGPVQARAVAKLLREALITVDESWRKADAVARLAGNISEDAAKYRNRLADAKCALVAAIRTVHELATQGRVTLN